MRIDAVTIFPDYFAPMQLSLLGKAQGQGILEINIHDLRSFTTDNHHTVDDTPYGGGAGMVMLPEVWGLAIDSVIADGATLIVLTPAGKRFTQEMAHGEIGLNAGLLKKIATELLCAITSWQRAV